MKNEISVSISLMLIIFMVFSPTFIHSNQAFAAAKFSVEAQIDLKKLNHPDKLKFVASANGDNETKYLTVMTLTQMLLPYHLNLTKRMTLLVSVVEMSTSYAHMPLIR